MHHTSIFPVFHQEDSEVDWFGAKSRPHGFGERYYNGAPFKPLPSLHPHPHYTPNPIHSASLWGRRAFILIKAVAALQEVHRVWINLQKVGHLPWLHISKHKYLYSNSHIHIFESNFVIFFVFILSWICLHLRQRQTSSFICDVWLLFYCDYMWLLLYWFVVLFLLPL